MHSILSSKLMMKYQPCFQAPGHSVCYWLLPQPWAWWSGSVFSSSNSPFVQTSVSRQEWYKGWYENPWLLLFSHPCSQFFCHKNKPGWLNTESQKILEGLGWMWIPKVTIVQVPANKQNRTDFKAEIWLVGNLFNWVLNISGDENHLCYSI